MKLQIHPDYKHLTSFFESIPSGMPQGGEVLRENRNLLYKVTAEGVVFVVKCYKRPRLFNRIVYTFLRKTKARRSYEYAGQLLRQRIDTSAPAAFIETKKHGLFDRGYFISEYIEEPLLFGVEEHLDRDRILSDFAAFSADMHQKRIMHGDYNAHNIFFRREGDAYRFSLIDNNRIHLRRPTRRRCAKDLKRLALPLPLLAQVFEEYARQRGWRRPEIFCARVFIERGINFPARQKRQIRNLLKKLSGKEMEYTNRQAIKAVP